MNLFTISKLIQWISLIRQDPLNLFNPRIKSDLIPFLDGKYLFEMHSEPKAAYIATGLSFDRKMGDDSVMECVKEGNEVKIYSSYTIRESGTFDAIRYGIPQNIIRLQEGKIDENGISCVIERDETSYVDSKTWDLKNGKYYLLMATGARVKQDRITIHNLGHAISDKTFNSYVWGDFFFKGM